MQNVRLSRIKNILTKGPFTRIFLSDPCDIEYLTGFRSSNVYCIISRRRNIICSDFRYREAAKEFCRKHREWKFLEVKENDFSSLKSALGTRNIVGCQTNVMTVDQLRLLRRTFPGIRFAGLPRSFSDVFVPKLPAEIGCMRRAAAIGDRALGAMLRRARPGVTEKELARVLEDSCTKLGSERPAFDTIVLFGERAALPHGRPSDARLKKGDWVLCDFGCTAGGFASDMTRTFVAGRASEKQKKVYGIVYKAQERARCCVAAGKKACEVDRQARSVITDAGFGPLFGHATGHGVGLRVHEKPRISSVDESILQEGTVITVEPGIYAPRFGGVRIEDMVVVRENGCKLLTNFPRHLIEVGSR